MIITSVAALLVSVPLAFGVSSGVFGAGGKERVAAREQADHSDTKQHRLVLQRQPYLGVSCTKPSSIACDRVKLAVWLRAPARRLTASIDGRTFSLRPPATRGGPWEGTLKRAGLRHAAGAGME